MKLRKTAERKSPYPSSPYVAELVLDAPSQVLTWGEVTHLHETARELCPQRFSWWCALPPEIKLISQIDYCSPPTIEDLPNVSALRIDIQAGYQFSGENKTLLTKEQLISLRKICYRVRSDFRMYALSGRLPTEFDWNNSQ